MTIGTLKIGLIGLGTIGKTLAGAIAKGIAGRSSLEAVLARPGSEAKIRACLSELSLQVEVTSSPDQFFDVPTDIVVEAAGQEAVRCYGASVLANGRDLLLCSSGAFTDQALFEELRAAAESNGRRIIIPTGAIAGMDAVNAASLAGVEEVTIVTRKPPRAWFGTVAENLVDLNAIGESPVCLFEGSSREATALFPQNINVAATLALAGVGLDRTQVRIYADPNIVRNLHTILVRGVCGDITIEVQGKPSPDNPRTTVLAAYSVIRAVRNLTASVIVG